MFEHQKILILGFARSGYEVAKLLRKRDNQVIINDGKPEEKHDSAKIQELKDLGVEFVFGSHPDNLLDNSFQYLIKNPGVPIDHSYVVKAKDLGIEVMNETELAYRLLPKDKNIKLIGITGTNGKTTTTTLIYNFIKEDGKRVHLAGNIGYPLCSFLDKLEENDIPETVQDVWDRVVVTSVLPVNEKYSSQVYLSLGGGAADTALATLIEMVPGYIGGSRIVDETTARYTLQIPGTQGRDGQNWTLVETENGTWLQVNGSLYMPQELATDLYTGSGWAYTTVGEEGYARWYHVGDAAGSTMTVQMPEDAGFWVYDASGTVTASSVLWDETSAVLPEGGMVVFAGDPGARFHLRFS